jgi:hypothetical protein
MFVNGTQVGTTQTNSVSYNLSVTSTSIGSLGTNYYWNGYISNLRVVKGTAVYTSNFTPSTTPLTAITNTSLLTLQSPTFIDNSTNNFTITANGNSQPSIQNPFGFTSATTNGYTVSTIGGSGYFDGTGDYLTVPSNAAFNQLYSTTISFTIEFWAYITANTSGGGANTLLSTYNSLDGYRIELHGDGVVYWVSNGTNSAIFYAVPLMAWSHLAFVWNGTTIKMYLNGVNVSSASAAWTNNSVALTIGNTAGQPFNYNGYISDLRITKGTAVYTSNFVPPTAPLTAVQNSTLLLNMTSAGIYDAAMMANMETVADAKLSTAISKFGGSSMYFDGTGDYLSIPINPSLIFGTGDFTVETWIYLPTIVRVGIIGMGSGGFFVEIASSGTNIHVSQADVVDLADFAISPALSANTWYHFAMTRSGTSLRAFINGIAQGSTVTNSTNFTGTNAVLVGGHPGGIILYSGYMDDMRVTKGYARYTSNFTPPSSAFPIF